MHPLRQCLRHQERVSGVVFSPDGTRLVTSCVDGTAQLWEAATGQPIGGALRHGGAVTAVAFSPDGRHLATACADGKLYRWDATTGVSLGPLGDGADREGAVRPAGALVPHCGRPERSRLEPGERHDPGHARPRRVGDGRGRQPRRLDAATGTDVGAAVLWELPAGAQRGSPLQHGCPVRSVALHPGGRLAAVGDEKGFSADLMQRELSFRPGADRAIRSSRVDHTRPQQWQPGPAIHLAFDRFQPIHLALDRTVAPSRRQGCTHRCLILSQTRSEADKLPAP